MPHLNRVKIKATCFLFFLIAITGCTRANKKQTDLAIFLDKYYLVYPEQYNFENNYYNLTSFKREFFDDSSTYTAKTYNVSGEFELLYETNPFYKFKVNALKLDHYLVRDAGSTLPYETFEEVLWDGHAAHRTFRYNNYPPSGEIWTERTYGTDQIENVILETRLYNINSVILAAKAISNTEYPEIFNAKKAEFINNRLFVYYEYYTSSTIVKIDFDENLHFSKYQIAVSFIPANKNPSQQNYEVTQILTPTTSFDVDVPSVYDDEYLIESDTLLLEVR